MKKVEQDVTRPQEGWEDRERKRLFGGDGSSRRQMKRWIGLGYKVFGRGTSGSYLELID